MYPKPERLGIPTSLLPAQKLHFPLFLLTMAPPHPRRPIAKDRFAALFPTLKVQTYHDPASRGPGSHTYAYLFHRPPKPLLTAPPNPESAP